MIVEVAAAVIERADGAFLLARRPAGKAYAGWWEFPGGKVEPGEEPAVALARELHEELGIEVRTAYPWITRVYAYQHATVRLNFFRVPAWDGEPHPKEEQVITWQRPDRPPVEPMLPANSPVLAALALPLEYAITDARTFGVERSLVHLKRRLRDGLAFIQVRDKLLPGRMAFARSVVELAHGHCARVLINGDESLARAAGADGVHWSAADLIRAQARPKDLLCGASCHDARELSRAAELGCDFAVLGPVRDTVSHPGAQTLGWQRFTQLAHGLSCPVYAIGGLGRSDLDSARRAGAHGLAMIRGAWS